MMQLVRFTVCGLIFGPELWLRRAPTFLRFVRHGEDWSTLDALDQFNDEPKPAETIIVARAVERGVIHIDGVLNGRKGGHWVGHVRYDFIEPQPPEDVLRDTAKWREWCLAEQADQRETAL